MGWRKEEGNFCEVLKKWKTREKWMGHNLESGGRNDDDRAE
jgi:hypothetical protein